MEQLLSGCQVAQMTKLTNTNFVFRDNLLIAGTSER